LLVSFTTYFFLPFFSFACRFCFSFVAFIYHLLHLYFIFHF
jgi:hypothetical protein